MPEVDQAELDRLRAGVAAGETAAAALEKSQEDLAGLTGAAERATASTAALLETTRAANPKIPSDLINGEDPATIAASVEGAKAIVAKVAELNPATAPVGAKPPPGGAGAPPRAGTGPPERARGISRISWALTNEKREE